jgi:Domain of unknown function (DUF3471)/Domain of unknown function (DUF4440)
MTTKQSVKGLLAFIVYLCLIPQLMAQTEVQKLTETILQKDSLFWDAYNKCDIESFPQFFDNDVEFYHDMGGMTIGLEGIISNMKKNLCADNGFRLRREAVEGSVKVFPLKSSGTIYGAIFSGEHVFYILEKGGERLDGLAKFNHLWLLKDGTWKMTRILSYDHGPAPYINKKKEIKVLPASLSQFTGTYKGPQSGALIVKKEQDRLMMQVGNSQMNLYPQAENQFFTKERDLTFEFIKDEKGKVTKMIVRENGTVVEETTPVQ